MGWFVLPLLLPPPPTHIHPLSGRVELLADDGRVHRLAHGAPTTDTGPALLVLGARASAEVAWPGCGSIRLVGPCVVEWDAPSQASADGGATTVVRFGELGRADVEWRVGELAVELPSGWRVGARRCAFGLALDGVGARVDARAGAPLVLEAPRGAGWLWPRRELAPGGAFRLGGGAPERRAVDASAEAPPWPSVEWPWGESAPSVSPVERRSLRSRSTRRRP